MYCFRKMRRNSEQGGRLCLAAASLALIISLGLIAADEQPRQSRPWLRSRSIATSRNAPQPTTSAPQAQQQPANFSSQKSPAANNGSAVLVGPEANNQPPTISSRPQLAPNRTVRTAADIFQNGDGYNIFVTNTCERESMRVNIRTSRPFYGIIHTRDQRAKQVCSVEGTGEVEYNLEISHILNQQDPAYCGVIRAHRNSAEDKDVLSVIVAVRVHRNIELSDDKFFLLNCTNRCRKSDCSLPGAKLLDLNKSGRLSETNDDSELETERTSTPLPGSLDRNPGLSDECTVWKFPWLITLLWCLGILLLAMVIANCIMCSSMVCQCVKTKVEEKEPSVYEGATDSNEDDDDNESNRVVNTRKKMKTNSKLRTIDYDNKDIYTTSNNYAPYNLEEVQAKSLRQTKSRRH